MPWIVRFEDEFEQEFLAFPQGVQDELLAAARVLAEYGPQLGRPYVDTLKGSKHANMLLTIGDRVSCWWPVTNREWARSASTSS
jgi:hypothetical protein